MKSVVFASGRGSTFAALIDAAQRDQLGGATLEALIVNKPGCGALDHARSAGIPAALVDHKAFSSRHDFEQGLLEAIEPFEVELIILAGFMRILTPYFLERAPCPIVNLHPSLLPSFPGAHALEDAFAAKVRAGGCSTHLVTAVVDEGPLLMQGVVPLHPDDALEDFAARVHRMEHRLLPATVAALATGSLRPVDGGVQTAKGLQTCLIEPS